MEDFSCCSFQEILFLATWSAELSASHSHTVSQSVTNSLVSSHSLTTQPVQCSLNRRKSLTFSVGRYRLLVAPL